MKIGNKVKVKGLQDMFTCLNGATGRISELLNNEVYTHPFVIVFENPVEGIESINLRSEEIEVLIENS